MEYKFDENMLPSLGVMWHWFSTEAEALAFADWAEHVTRHSQYPCEALVTICDDRPEHEQFEVKVRNW